MEESTLRWPTDNKEREEKEEVCSIGAVVDRGVGDWGSCPGHQGRGTKEGRAKITRNCMTKNVIDFIILNNQMFRINDIDIYNINQYSVALH